jgi:CRP/FNR family cyclic AMP-dependent transcriptional regulator
MPKAAAKPASAALQDALLVEIAAKAPVRAFAKGAVIITEGDETTALYVILSGRVKAYASDESGREIDLSVQEAGDYFGEMSLDGGQRSASVMALEATRCAVVPREELRRFLASHPDFAQHLIERLIGRVRTLTGTVKSLALLDVYGRVARLLLELAVEEDGQTVIPQRLTHQDIANRVGASRETVSRILSELMAGGYLAKQGSRLVIRRQPPKAW